MRLLQAQEIEKQEEYLQDYYTALRTLCAKRQKGGPYFLGNEFTLVDVAIAPWVLRDYNLTEHRGYKREDAGQEWVDWANALEKRESVWKTQSVSTFTFFLMILCLTSSCVRTKSNMQTYISAILKTRHRVKQRKLREPGGSFPDSY